MMDKGSRLV